MYTRILYYTLSFEYLIILYTHRSTCSDPKWNPIFTYIILMYIIILNGFKGCPFFFPFYIYCPKYHSLSLSECAHAHSYICKTYETNNIIVYIYPTHDGKTFQSDRVPGVIDERRPLAYYILYYVLLRSKYVTCTFYAFEWSIILYTFVFIYDFVMFTLPIRRVVPKHNKQ